MKPNKNSLTQEESSIPQVSSFLFHLSNFRIYLLISMQMKEKTALKLLKPMKIFLDLKASHLKNKRAIIASIQILLKMNQRDGSYFMPK